jgi:hypothetical protein
MIRPKPGIHGYRAFVGGRSPGSRVVSVDRAAGPTDRVPCRQPAATATGFSIGTPIMLPYSVQLPS